MGILDLIQVFVEALDKCFENVCELDLIFHSDKVNYILDEIIMAGMVLETNINHILASVGEQNKMHIASQRVHVPPTGNAATQASVSTMGTAASQAKDTANKIFSSISTSLSR